MNTPETMLISTLYKGPHYNLLSPYKSDIISNHKKFAEYNDFDYRLYNGGELEYRYDAISPYEFSEYDIPVYPINTFPGVGKLYAILAAKEDYPGVSYFVFADFDSIFLQRSLLTDVDNYDGKERKLNYQNHMATFSGRQFPYLYDNSFYYYYSMYKDITYSDLEKYSDSHRFNSGLFVVNREFITQESVDEYVNFCKDVHEDKTFYTFCHSKETSGMRLKYTEDDNKDDNNHALFHPSDEVYLQYQRMHVRKNVNNTHYPTLDSSWNFIGKIQDNWEDVKHLKHIHCIDKSQIPIALEKSNV